MKNLKIYLLLILGIFAVSTVFTSELIAQTKKKPRKKTTTTKKKIVKKETAPVEKFRIDPNAVQVIPANSSGESGVTLGGAQPNNVAGVKTVSDKIVNGKAIDLVKPEYPPAAKAVKASGAVNVQVTIDEEGNVISASAISGHPLLRAAAVSAARESKFSPTTFEGQKVKVIGVIVYNFTPQ
jgi:TonB family protein